MTFNYKPSPLLMVLCIAFFALCTWVFSVMHPDDLSGQRGLARYIAGLDPTSRAIALNGLIGLSAAFVLAGVYGLYRSLTNGGVIEITDTYVRAPKRMGGKTLVEVHFADVIDVERQAISGQEWITLKTQSQTLSLFRQGVGGKKNFQALVDAILERLPK